MGRSGAAGRRLLVTLAISGGLLVAFGSGMLITRVLALGEPLHAAARPESAQYVLLVSSIVVGLLLVAQPNNRWHRRALLLGAALLFAIFNAIDLTFLSYFSQPTVVLFPYLPLPEAHLATLGTLWTYIHQYVAPQFVLVTLASTLPAFAGLYWLVPQRPHRQIAALLLVTGAFSASEVLAARSTTRSTVTAPELEALKLDPHVELRDLWRAERRGSFELLAAPRARPRTIVMVVNESAGYVLPASQDPSLRLVDRLLQHSGAPDAWQVYPNAVTNSNATDVSVPSILTGSATHEGIEKLHALPSVFDLAKARGYRTVYFTSSVMGWANLGVFLSTAPIDLLMDASTAGYPFLNDLATDDMAMMKDLRRFLLALPADQDIFLYVYPNAMHTPYQHTGDIVFPEGMDDVVLRALFVLESEHK
ncbi:MAG: sulfatase-like hydrolase/transferase, partial [Deltaproteobacteria bacterium]|nr:sulfatase-like hydrolase/transferase [Deltaproteobacteria bacterium]